MKGLGAPISNVLTYKHEDLISVLRTHTRKWEVVVCAYNPSSGEET